MVRPMPIIHVSETLSSPIPLAIFGLFVSATLLVTLCARQVVPRKYTSKTKDPNTEKAPLPIISPKQLITTTISNNCKAMMVNTKKQEHDAIRVGENNNNEENGVWQKAILMGERCQPPEFSGVIYYDYCGNMISEMPKSPLRNFSFPVEKNENSVH